MSLLDLATRIERVASIAVFVAAGTLAYLTGRAWFRERSRRLAYVTLGYVLFAAFGLAIAIEPLFVALGAALWAEVIEHGALVLVLVGLLTFFAAILRD